MKRLLQTCCWFGLCASPMHMSLAVPDSTDLLQQINELRANPSVCDNIQRDPLQPLNPDERLTQAIAADRDDLQAAISSSGYLPSAMQLLGVAGVEDAHAAMSVLQRQYCSALLDPEYTDVGIFHSDNTWQLLLASPLLSNSVGNWENAGREVLEFVNAARSQGHTCGDDQFERTTPLQWNRRLARAALAHSNDMASRSFFDHAGSDGAQVSDRAEREGYVWQQIGENIAAGQGAPEDVVAGWLESPPHCANLMNADFTEMGAAFSVNPESSAGIYWTQVLGTPSAN